MIKNCPDLGGGIAFADYKKISRGVIDLSQIEFDNIFAFFFLYTFNNEVIKYLRLILLNSCFSQIPQLNFVGVIK